MSEILLVLITMLCASDLSDHNHKEKTEEKGLNHRLSYHVKDRMWELQTVIADEQDWNKSDYFSSHGAIAGNTGRHRWAEKLSMWKCAEWIEL